MQTGSVAPPVEVIANLVKSDVGDSQLTVVYRKRLKESIKTLERTFRKTVPLLYDSTTQKTEHPQPAPLARCRLVSVTNEISRPNKVFIDVRVVFIKVGEIDTVRERFHADAFIQAKWREPLLDGEAKDVEFQSDDITARPNFWDPRLYIENVLGEVKESLWYVTSFNKVGQAIVYQRRRVKGTFFERMELNQFPFDTQDLTLTITSDRGELECALNPDQSEISTVNVQSFVDEQEWKLHKHINIWKQITTNAYKKHKHPVLSISCTATRRSPFFLWNIILVMMFICTLIFTTFTVDQNLPQSRMQLSFILLLSNITFKFTVNQTLPKVSYLTYLDKYILISMAILCLVCVWHAVVSQLWVYVGVQFAKNADMIAFAILVFLYILYNVIFFAYSKFMVTRRAKLYHQRDKVQRERQRLMEVRAAEALRAKEAAANKNHIPES